MIKNFSKLVFVTFIPNLLLICVIAALNSGCLKSRAQLRDEGGSQAQADPGAEKEPTVIAKKGAPGEPSGEVKGDSYVLDEIKQEITRLTGRIEDLERKLQADNSGQSKSSEEFKKFEARVVEIEQAQVQLIEQLKKLQLNVPPPDQGEKFEKAKAQYAKNDFESAIDSFSAYLKDPGTKNAAEATYLRGDSYFQTKQYKKAIADFAQFPEKWAKSPRTPEALYRIGLSFLAIDAKEDAKAFFQELVDKYPKSPLAAKARAKLKKK